MNCNHVQRRLLGVADPQRPPSSIRPHLAECAACQEYQRRLVQIERHVPRLQVPPSTYAKARVLREVRQGPGVWTTVQNRLGSVPGRVKSLGRWRVGGIGLAAAIVLFVLAWKLSIVPEKQMAEARPSGPDPLLASLVPHAVALAETQERTARVEELAKLADDLSGEAKVLAHGANTRPQVQELAEWYRQVVRKEVERAEKLEPAERNQVLPALSQRLAQAATEIEEAAREVGATGNHPLLGLANAAREARKDLDQLRGQQTSAPLFPEERRIRLAAAGLMFAVAETSSAARTAEEHAIRFKQNEKLLQAMVQGCLLLSTEDDALKRAGVCNAVVRRLAQEIERAATDRQGARAAELGDHLRRVLEHGVAPNLTTAAKEIKIDSMMQNERLRNLGKEVEQVTEPLEQQLQANTDPETRAQLEKTQASIREGRVAVEKIFQARGQPLKPELRTDP